MSNRDYNKTTWIMAGFWWVFMVMVVGPLSQSYNHPYMFGTGLVAIFGFRQLRKRAVLAKAAENSVQNMGRTQLTKDKLVQTDAMIPSKAPRWIRVLKRLGLFALIIFTLPLAMQLSGMPIAVQIVTILAALVWLAASCLQLFLKS